MQFMHKEERVDAIFREVIKDDAPGAALAVIQDDSIIYRKGYGLANMEYDIPITPSTIFHVASVSKQFTAFSIAMLAGQGKLSFDDDIRKHLPEVPDFGKTITIRHLIHHTSGMRDQWELLSMAGWRLDDVITQEHIMKMVRHQRELNFDPGEEHLYCNTGYTLLAEIVEHVSGQPFREYTKANIFVPLDMADTHFHDDHRMIVRNRAYSYELEDGTFKNSVLSFANVGATSLFTTVEDLSKWVQGFYNGAFGGEAVIRQMHQRGVLNNGEELTYAFGLVFGEYRGLGTIGHGGADAGYRSNIIWFPEQKFGVVVLANLGSLDAGGLARQVAGVYLAEQLEPEEEKPEIDESSKEETKGKPPMVLELGEFVGDYYSDELGTTYTIAIEDDHLVVKHRRHGDVSLAAIDADNFKGESWRLARVNFQRDENRQVTGFRLSAGRVRNLLFEKQGKLC